MVLLSIDTSGMDRGGSVRYTVPGVSYRIPYRKLRYDKNHTDTVQ